MTVTQFDAIASLHNWSLNFDCGRNPFCVFLDLIGYSQEEYGCKLYEGDPSEVMGYKELCLLAEALKVFETNGNAAVYACIRDLTYLED